MDDIVKDMASIIIGIILVNTLWDSFTNNFIITK